MTPRQIALARHALGLTASCLVSYRNVSVAGPGHPDYAPWMNMVAWGWAIRRESEYLPPGDVLFRLTRVGAELALLPGDRLDPEVWGPTYPSVPRLSPDGTYYICDQCGRDWRPGTAPGCEPCSKAYDERDRAAGRPC